MTNGSRTEPGLDAPIVEWLLWALPRHGYDPTERGFKARFAEASGIPRATVSRLMSGTSGVDTDTLLAAARTLGVPVLPLLVRAGLVPREVLDEAPPTPKTPSPTTQRQALAVLGATDKADQNAVLSMIRALRAAKGEGDAT